jgi:hypothetical protein
VAACGRCFGEDPGAGRRGLADAKGFSLSGCVASDEGVAFAEGHTESNTQSHAGSEAFAGG